MQEHIRRAHPEHYISKLPATEESFLLMINTPPSERRHTDQAAAPATQGLLSLDAILRTFSKRKSGFHDRHGYYRAGSSNPGTPRRIDDSANTNGASLIGAASAAAVL